mgnify:CR=1 FL=1
MGRPKKNKVKVHTDIPFVSDKYDVVFTIGSNRQEESGEDLVSVLSKLKVFRPFLGRASLKTTHGKKHYEFRMLPRLLFQLSLKKEISYELLAKRIKLFLK